MLPAFDQRLERLRLGEPGSMPVRSRGPRSMRGVGASAHLPAARFSLPSFPVFGALSASHQRSTERRARRRRYLDEPRCRRGLQSERCGLRVRAGSQDRRMWQYVRVSARDPASGTSGSAASSLFGVRAGDRRHWTLARPLALVDRRGIVRVEHAAGRASARRAHRHVSAIPIRAARRRALLAALTIGYPGPASPAPRPPVPPPLRPPPPRPPRPPPASGGSPPPQSHPLFSQSHSS